MVCNSESDNTPIGELQSWRRLSSNINCDKISYWEYYQINQHFPVNQYEAELQKGSQKKNYSCNFLLKIKMLNAETLWMTQSALQAGSNIFKVNISILTTGVKSNKYSDTPRSRWTHFTPNDKMEGLI